MVTIVSEVTGLQQRHHLLKINLILLSRSKAFHWRKIVSKYCKLSKTMGRGSIRPSPLYHGWGMNLGVRPRVNPVKLIWIIFFQSFALKPKGKNWKGIIKIMMVVIIIIINITINIMQFSFAKKHFAGLIQQVTREKGQSSVLLFSQFCGSKEILVNSVKFFPHENCLSFS